MSPKAAVLAGWVGPPDFRALGHLCLQRKPWTGHVETPAPHPPSQTHSNAQFQSKVFLPFVFLESLL